MWAEIFTIKTPLYKNLMSLKIETGPLSFSFLVLLRHIERKEPEQDVYFISLECNSYFENS